MHSCCDVSIPPIQCDGTDYEPEPEEQYFELDVGCSVYALKKSSAMPNCVYAINFRANILKHWLVKE